MYELLANAAAKNPVAGNAGSSYVTMRSTGGIIFGVLNIVGNFGVSALLFSLYRFFFNFLLH